MWAHCTQVAAFLRAAEAVAVVAAKNRYFCQLQLPPTIHLCQDAEYIQWFGRMMAQVLAIPQWACCLQWEAGSREK